MSFSGIIPEILVKSAERIMLDQILFNGWPGLPSCHVAQNLLLSMTKRVTFVGIIVAMPVSKSTIDNRNNQVGSFVSLFVCAHLKNASVT